MSSPTKVDLQNPIDHANGTLSSITLKQLKVRDLDTLDKATEAAKAGRLLKQAQEIRDLCVRFGWPKEFMFQLNELIEAAAALNSGEISNMALTVKEISLRSGVSEELIWELSEADFKAIGDAAGFFEAAPETGAG